MVRHDDSEAVAGRLAERLQRRPGPFIFFIVILWMLANVLYLTAASWISRAPPEHSPAVLFITGLPGAALGWWIISHVSVVWRVRIWVFSQYVYFGSIFTVLGGVVCAMLLWPLERDAVVVGRSVMIILCATGAVGGGLIGVIIAKRYMKHIFR